MVCPPLLLMTMVCLPAMLPICTVCIPPPLFMVTMFPPRLFMPEATGFAICPTKRKSGIVRNRIIGATVEEGNFGHFF